MGKHLYPDMDYQEEVYNKLVAYYQGRDMKKYDCSEIKGKAKRCRCPQCGRHSASFFMGRDETTYIMTCIDGCGLNKTLHQLVLDYGDKDLIEEWKGKLHRLNFEHYGTAMPIKNAGRPKGSKTNKKSPPINAYLKDEIHTRRFRGGIQRHLRGAKPSFEA